MADNKDQVLQDIADRVKASMDGDLMTQDDVRRMISEEFEKFTESPVGQERKFRFADGEKIPSVLFGSKFSRYKYSLEDIEYLYDLQVSLRSLDPSRHKGPSEELEAAFKQISRAYYMSDDALRDQDERAIREYFKHEVGLNDYYGNDRALAARGAWEETQAYQRAIANVQSYHERDMGTAQSGAGQELIGVNYAGDLWDQGMAEARIASMIRSYEMNGPTDYLPVAGTIPEMHYVGEKVGGSASDYATVDTGSNRVQVNAKKFIIHQIWPTEMEEDSIIPYVPMLREMAQFSISFYTDSVIINGDTTNAGTGNINLDDADPADTKHYLSVDGIRHAGLVDATAMSQNAAGAISLALLLKPRERMIDTTYHNDWGNPARQDDFIQIADPTTAIRISQIDEVINWKTQQGRPFRPGQLAEILGGPVFGHVAVSKTEADGKVSTTGSNNTKGQVVSLNKNGCVMGWLRRVRTTIAPKPETDQNRIVHTLRFGFGRYTPTGAASGIKWADVIYNIDLS